MTYVNSVDPDQTPGQHACLCPIAANKTGNRHSENDGA